MGTSFKYFHWSYFWGVISLRYQALPFQPKNVWAVILDLIEDVHHAISLRQCKIFEVSNILSSSCSYIWRMYTHHLCTLLGVEIVLSCLDLVRDVSCITEMGKAPHLQTQACRALGVSGTNWWVPPLYKWGMKGSWLVFTQLFGLRWERRRREREKSGGGELSPFL